MEERQRGKQRRADCEVRVRLPVFREGETAVRAIDRITFDPHVMGGKPCVRGMRVTVGTILGLLASAHSEEEILRAYPYLERDDIRAARRVPA